MIALRVIECLSYKTLYYTKLLRFLLISASFSDYRIQSVPTSAKFNRYNSTGAKLTGAKFTPSFQVNQYFQAVPLPNFKLFQEEPLLNDPTSTTVSTNPNHPDTRFFSIVTSHNYTQYSQLVSPTPYTTTTNT